MTDTKRGPDTAEPDLPPSYDETNIPSAALPKPPPQPLLRPPPLPLELPALAALRGKRVILASASPRRKQLLAQVKCFFSPYSFVITPPRRHPLSHHNTLTSHLSLRPRTPPASIVLKKKTKKSTYLKSIPNQLPPPPEPFF